MNNFLPLYRSGITKRWHTHDTLRQQSVAEHSWGVALICSELMPGSLNLMRAALFHDMAESKYGDIPYTSKIADRELKRRSEMLEAQWNQQHEIEMPLTPQEYKCLKWADMFEAYLFALRETKAGNQLMLGVVDNAWKALRDMGAPNIRAEEMFQEMTG